MRRHLRIGALGLVALTGMPAGAVSGQRAFGAADVAVTLSRAGGVRVEERYVLAPPPAAIELRALLRPCADIRAVLVSRAGVELPGVSRTEGPWLILGDVRSPVSGADTLRFEVAYEVVTRGGRIDVPLIHLAMPLAQKDDQPEGPVRLHVRTADPGDRVLFPHATRRGPTEWEARYIAIPSFVEIALAGDDRVRAEDCPDTGEPVGGDGGLTWRFLVLVGIMGAWVPLYLAWARRSGEGAA